MPRRLLLYLGRGSIPRVYLTPLGGGSGTHPYSHLILFAPSSLLHSLPVLRIPCIITSRNRSRRTTRNTSSPFTMTLFSSILEILDETMMFLSVPRLLDRVLTRLCKLPLHSLVSFLVVLINPRVRVYSMGVAVRCRHRIAAFCTCSPTKLSDGLLSSPRAYATPKTIDLCPPVCENMI